MESLRVRRWISVNSNNIRENYGGFNVHFAGVPTPTITRIAPLKYQVNLNTHVSDPIANYAVEIYINDTFLMLSSKLTIDLTQSPSVLSLYQKGQKIKVAFITRKIVGEIKRSEPFELYEQQGLCSESLLCSESTICKAWED